MVTGADYLIRRLRLRHLEMLVALAEAGTMRAASARLNLSQPAMSKMLSEVEAGFSARLFERSHQGVQANNLGKAAIHRARVILSELARASDDIDALRTGASAVLRVGAPSVTAAVPAAIVELRKRLPAASVRIREGRVRELIDRLLNGELDCVFGAVTPELLSSDVMPHLRSEVLLEDELCILAADANPLVHRRGLRWAALRESSWVAPPRETLVRQAFINAFLTDGVDPPEPVIEAMSSVTVGSVLRLDPTLLCAVRFEHARDEVARGGVKRLAVSPAIALPPFGLFTRRGAIDHLPVVQEFARAIRHSGASATPTTARRAAPSSSRV